MHIICCSFAGEYARRPHDACTSPKYDSGGMEFTTLVGKEAVIYFTQKKQNA